MILEYYDDRNREYFRGGERTNPDKLGINASAINYTKIHKIPIYLTGYYELDETGERDNPLEHITHFTGRILGHAREGALNKDYKTAHRNFKIVNVEEKKWETETIEKIFPRTGVFSSYNSTQEVPTSHGLDILKTCVNYTPSAFDKERNDAYANNPINLLNKNNNKKSRNDDDDDDDNDMRGLVGGASYSRHNERTGSVPTELNAFNLYTSAGIIDPVTQIISDRGIQCLERLFKIHKHCNQYFRGNSRSPWEGGFNQFLQESSGNGSITSSATGVDSWNGADVRFAKGLVLPTDEDEILRTFGSGAGSLKSLVRILKNQVADGDFSINGTESNLFDEEWTTITDDDEKAFLILSTKVYIALTKYSNATNVKAALDKAISALEDITTRLSVKPKGLNNYLRDVKNKTKTPSVHAPELVKVSDASIGGYKRKGMSDVLLADSHPSKRTSTSVTTYSGGGNSDQNISESAIHQLLLNIPLTRSFFKLCINHDLPFPLSFMGFRTFSMGAQPIIAVVKGVATGVHIVDKAEVHYVRNPDTADLRVGTVLTNVTLIHDKTNIVLSPDSVPTRYVGGGNVKAWDFETHGRIYSRNDNRTASIHWVVVPYSWRPAYHFTSKTEKMDENLYAPAAQVGDETTYPTAKTYDRDMWNWSRYYEDGHNLFSKLFYNSENPRNATIAVQEYQLLCSDNDGLIYADSIPSRLPFGPVMFNTHSISILINNIFYFNTNMYIYLLFYYYYYKQKYDPETLTPLFGLTQEFTGNGLIGSGNRMSH